MLMQRTRPFLALTFLIGMVLLAGQGLASHNRLTAQVFDGGGLIEGLTKARSELSGSGLRDDADIVVTIVKIINFLLLFVALAVLVSFVVSGFLFILGFGSDTSIQRAKKIMIWSAVGLVVILFAFLLTEFIITASTA